MRRFADDTIDDKESAAAKAEVDHFEAFQKWLLDNGAEFPDLYLKRYTDNMRGVHASRPIESYSTVVAIPLKCLITDHMGRTETELGRLMFAPGTPMHAHARPALLVLVLFLLLPASPASYSPTPFLASCRCRSSGSIWPNRTAAD